MKKQLDTEQYGKNLMQYRIHLVFFRIWLNKKLIEIILFRDLKNGFRYWLK